MSKSMKRKKSVAIVWFRCCDLRLMDHEPLHTAHTQHDEVLHVYCFDSRSHGTSSVNYSKSVPRVNWPKTGYFRAKFLRESVTNLRENLQSIGQNLYIGTGIPEEIIPRIAKLYDACVVYCHSAEAPEEQLVQDRVASVLASTHLQPIWGNTLYHVDDIPFTKKNSFPGSCTQFRTKCESKCVIRPALPSLGDTAGCPVRPAPISTTSASNVAVAHADGNEVSNDWGDIPSLQSLLGYDTSSISPASGADTSCNFSPEDPRGVMSFQGGETSGLQRVRDYIWTKKCLRTYFTTRNGMVGADYSSKFSPWLAHGCISARWIAHEVRRFEETVEKSKETYWMIFELTFRDYFRYYMKEHGSSVFHLHGPKKRLRNGNGTPAAAAVTLSWSQDMTLFEKWRTGNTGNPMIDANMRELLHTGFMSNRGRQIVASYLTRDMGLDWRLGAMHFESLLIDHDPCQNYGNWTYAAGVGSDPREDRYFNVPKQTRTYDPSFEFIYLWVEESRTWKDTVLLQKLKHGTKQNSLPPPPRKIHKG